MDLQVLPGDRVAVLGPNGSGKTTLLRILAGLLRPDSGSLTLLGGSVPPVPPKVRRRIGYGGDRPVHFDALTGRENVRFFARSSGLDGDRAVAETDRLLDALHLAEDADVPAGEYSFGMRRKLLLVESLVHAPRLLLLDEPTVGLDPPSTQSLQEILETRSGSDTGAVLATNDVLWAQEVATEVVFLHGGTVVAAGRPGRFLEEHRGRTEMEFLLDGPLLSPPAIPETRTVHSSPGRLVLESESGARLLPEACAALLEAGARIRNVTIREPDLRDVFRRLTGEELAG